MKTEGDPKPEGTGMETAKPGASMFEGKPLVPAEEVEEIPTTLKRDRSSSPKEAKNDKKLKPDDKECDKKEAKSQNGPRKEDKDKHKGSESEIEEYASSGVNALVDSLDQIPTDPVTGKIDYTKGPVVVPPTRLTFSHCNLCQAQIRTPSTRCDVCEVCEWVADEEHLKLALSKNTKCIRTITYCSTCISDKNILNLVGEELKRIRGSKGLPPLPVKKYISSNGNFKVHTCQRVRGCWDNLRRAKSLNPYRNPPAKSTWKKRTAERKEEEIMEEEPNPSQYPSQQRGGMYPVNQGFTQYHAARGPSQQIWPPPLPQRPGSMQRMMPQPQVWARPGMTAPNSGSAQGMWSRPYPMAQARQANPGPSSMRWSGQYGDPDMMQRQMQPIVPMQQYQQQAQAAPMMRMPYYPYNQGMQVMPPRGYHQPGMTPPEAQQYQGYPSQYPGQHMYMRWR